MLAQTLIVIFGAIAIFLTQQKHEWLKKYACFFGLISQPFFIFETYHSSQWGMLALALFYTWSFSLGLYHNWIETGLIKSSMHAVFSKIRFKPGR